MSYKILIINPGSTSTKIGVYEDETQLMEETLRHTTEEIAQYDTIYDQKDFRKDFPIPEIPDKVTILPCCIKYSPFITLFEFIMFYIIPPSKSFN